MGTKQLSAFGDGESVSESSFHPSWQAQAAQGSDSASPRFLSLASPSTSIIWMFRPSPSAALRIISSLAPSAVTIAFSLAPSTLAPSLSLAPSALRIIRLAPSLTIVSLAPSALIFLSRPARSATTAALSRPAPFLSLPPSLPALKTGMLTVQALCQGRHLSFELEDPFFLLPDPRGRWELLEEAARVAPAGFLVATS